MRVIKKFVYAKLFFTTTLLVLPTIQATTQAKLEQEEQQQFINQLNQPVIRRINQIIIAGNATTPTQAILNYVPYKEGEIFDPKKSRKLIRNLYYNLPRFRNVTVKGENVGSDLINIYIDVQEKYPLKDVLFKGNTAVTEKEIRKKVELDNIKAIDPEELKIVAEKIKGLYIEKGYHKIAIDTKYKLDKDKKGVALFIFNEGNRSLVKQIKFTGNETIESKKLKNAIFTREDWILGFLDGSGTYIADRLDGDKHMIEQMYQNYGFLQAKVTDVDVAIDPSGNIALTFDIQEGDRYKFGKIEVPGTEEVSEGYLLARLPIRTGQYYSRERLVNSIKALETIWGNFGYIFAHIEPSMQPDEENKTIDISFLSELGSKVKLNRVNIRGNRKTRDKIIRRRLMVDEGDTITKYDMEMSKLSVQSLGYFDQRDGVNWKIRRIDEEWADLDLYVKEAKTGHFNFQVGFGGAGLDLSSPNSGFTVKTELAETNLFGTGCRINLNASWAKNQQTLVFHFAQPWLFDRPITGAMDIYHKRPTFSNFGNLQVNSVNQKLTGGVLTAGYITRYRALLLQDTQIQFSLGIDGLKYERLPIAQIMGARGNENEIYQCILDHEFRSGTYAWLANSITQDRRNHPMHPSRGQFYTWTTKVALPSFDSCISFFKSTIDAHWFTPIINEYDLVLHLHGFLGVSKRIKGRDIPFGELFHIGGDTSVRGYNFGEIGPKLFGDSLGSANAFFVNVELIFPVTPDFSIKGVVFYDGGAGWTNPYVDDCNACDLVIDNNFDYRHSVGVGVRLLQPMPLRVDWGFKIDPRTGESAYETHFGMSYDW